MPSSRVFAGIAVCARSPAPIAAGSSCLDRAKMRRQGSIEIDRGRAGEPRRRRTDCGDFDRT
jgi:hypothetical protein